MTSDTQLLEAYATSGSEPAFTELVNRHVDLVYSAALRVVAGDSHLAEDVTQTVFAELARKARLWPREAGLAGWLYRCAWFTAAKAVRTESRRRAREQTAVEMTTHDDPSEARWSQIAPALDEAMNRLRSTDREAILLRYFKGQELRAVGAALGLSEGAAQKKVSRAVDKLRTHLGRRGVTLSAGTLSTFLLTEATKAAPAGLSLSITAASLSAAATAGTGAAVSLLEIMTTTKIKAAVAGAVLVAGIGTSLVLQQQTLKETRGENRALQEQVLEIDQLRAENERLTRLQIPADEQERFRAERAELERLRAQMAAAPTDPAPSLEGGSGAFRAATELVDAGMATPEATIETLLWAALHEENDRAMDILDLDRMRTAMLDYMKETDPDAVLGDEMTMSGFTLMTPEQRAEFVAFQVMNQQFHAPDHVEIEAAMSLASGRVETQRLILRRTGEEWKLDLLATAALDPARAAIQAERSQMGPDGAETFESIPITIEEVREPRLVPSPE